MSRKKVQVREHRVWLTVWIYLLSLVSGYINVATIVSFATPVTHVTGTITKTSIQAFHGNWRGFFFSMMVLASFFIGSAVSGMFFSDKRFGLKHRYGLLLMCYGAVLFSVSTFFDLGKYITWLLAFIVGSQNGMFIFYRGTLVRTSHFTGYLTDAGFTLGMLLKGETHEYWKLIFYGINIIIFSLGGAFYLVTLHYIGERYLQCAAVMYILIGLYYFIFRNIFFHAAHQEKFKR